MAKSRSTRNTHPAAKTTASQKSRQRKVQRLFQSDVLTALFGRSVGTLITRSLLAVVVIGVLAFIVVGLLRPNAVSTTPSSPGATVGLQIGDVAPNFTLTSLD